MVAIYILVALFVLLLNAEKVPSVFAQIFAAAFSGEAVTGGFCRDGSYWSGSRGIF